MLHTDDGAAKFTSADFRIQSTQPEPASVLNRCMRGTWAGKLFPVWWELSRRDLLSVPEELNLTNSGRDEVLCKWGPCGLPCQCGWGQKTLNPGADLPTSWQMEAIGFLKPQSHGPLSQCNAYLHTFVFKHITDVMEDLAVGARKAFLKENYSRQRTAQTNPSCGCSEKGHVTFVWHYLQFWTTFFGVLHKIMCIGIYRLKNNLWHIF